MNSTNTPGVGGGVSISTQDSTKWEELELELRARVGGEVGRRQLVTRAEKGLPANKGKQRDSRDASLCFPRATGQRAGSTEPRDPGRFVSPA